MLIVIKLKVALGSKIGLPPIFRNYLPGVEATYSNPANKTGPFGHHNSAAYPIEAVVVAGSDATSSLTRGCGVDAT